MSNCYESFIEMANRVGYFGQFQNDFDKARYDNGGYIDSLHLDRSVENEVNYYKLTYTLISRQNDLTRKFIVKIEENKIDAESDPKTTINIFMEMKAQNYPISRNDFDKTIYHNKAGEWLNNALFGHKDYKYVNVTLTLPPTYEPMSVNPCEKIKLLTITVPPGERDKSVVYWWLYEFTKTETIEYIKIESESNIEIRNSECLKKIPRVEINGTCDIDREFLEHFKGNCFYWRNMREENKLPETELLRACMDCVEYKDWKAIILDQGSVPVRCLILEELKKTYPKGIAEVNGLDFFFQRENMKFRFGVNDNGLVFGNIAETAHMNRRTALEWPEPE